MHEMWVVKSELESWRERGASRWWSLLLDGRSWHLGKGEMTTPRACGALLDIARHFLNFWQKLALCWWRAGRAHIVTRRVLIICLSLPARVHGRLSKTLPRPFSDWLTDSVKVCALLAQMYIAGALWLLKGLENGGVWARHELLNILLWRTKNYFAKSQCKKAQLSIFF